MTKIGVVGPTRNVSSLVVVDFIRRLAADTVVVAGGARGVQEAAVWAAESRGLKTEIHRPDFGSRQRSVEQREQDKWAALDKATDELIEASDELHAFVKYGERANSVLTAMVKAKRLGKPVTVHYDAPGGTAEVLVPSLPSPLRRSLAEFIFTWERHGTQTGRFAASKPNVSQVER
jgi:hypothetical protein